MPLPLSLMRSSAVIGFGDGADAELRRIVSLYFACIAVSLCPICAVLGLVISAVLGLAVYLMPNCAASYRCISLVSLYRYARFARCWVWRCRWLRIAAVLPLPFAVALMPNCRRVADCRCRLSLMLSSGVLDLLPSLMSTFSILDLPLALSLMPNCRRVVYAVAAYR